MGIEAEIERLGARNANMWAILEGEDPQALVLHSHIDVDPLGDLSAWRHPPFGGVYDPPWIYGRGAFDMKSVAIAQLLSIMNLKRQGTPLRRSVMFLATGDEESGGSELGAQWFIREHPELVARFWGLLTEGGAVEAVTLDDVRYWGTEFCQKRFIDVWVCAAQEERLTALREDLIVESDRVARPHLTEPVRQFFALYGPTRGLEPFRRALDHPDQLLGDGTFHELPPRVIAMLRNELAVSPVTEADGNYQIRVILHLVPGEELSTAWHDLALDQLLSGFAFMVDEPHPDTGCSPLDHPLLQGIDAFMAKKFPRWDHGPLIVPWAATDARFFRGVGVPAYGFSPFLILSADSTKMTAANERIPGPPFVAGVELYADVVRSLVSAQGTPAAGPN